MKVITKIITAISTILIFSCHQEPQKEIEVRYKLTQSNDFLNAQYVKNYDGDTVTFNLPNCNRSIFCNNISVRIAKIDTAEIRSKNKCEKDSALFAKNLVGVALSKAKRIDLKNCQKGKYFRLICDVIFDQKNLADILIKANLAYYYQGGKKENINWCKYQN
jgi:micrococcal nuclease